MSRERGARELVKLVGLFRTPPSPAREGRGPDAGGYGDSSSGKPYSLANACLKAYCDALPRARARYDVRLVDLRDASAPAAVEEFRLKPADVAFLAEGAPAAVCFSAYCWNLEAVLEACRALKKLLPGTKTVVGGRAGGSSPARFLDDNPSVDFLVSGEGEAPFSALLLSGFAPRRPIAGLCRRGADGRALPGSAPRPLLDLDSIPSPYAGEAPAPPPEGMLLELSRGCLHACGYCDWNAAKPRRRFSAARVASDLKWALAKGVRHVTLVDSAVNYETPSLRDFVSVLGRVDPGRTLSFSYNLRFEHVDAEQAELLKRIPPRQVLLGLETVNDAALANSGRARFEPGRFERALRLASESSAPLIGVVLGLPGDTAEGFIATMEYLGRLAARRDGTRVGAVLVSLLQVFEGTRLDAERARFGLETRARGIPYLTGSSSFPFEDLQECVRYLQRFRFRHRVVVKGPEGLPALEDGRGPGLLGENLRSLLEPWEPGGALSGWRFEDAAAIQDGEGFGVYGFRRLDTGDEAEIRLDRRDGAKPCSARSSYFNINCRTRVPGGDAASSRLLDVVRGLVRDNEGWVVGL